MVGLDERREAVGLLTGTIEREQRNYAANTETSLWMLVLLREGETARATDYLATVARVGRRPVQAVGNELIDGWSDPGRPSAATLRKAYAHQKKYCSDPCLGL